MSWTFNYKPKQTHFEFKVFNSLDELKIDTWNLVLNNSNLFLSIPYLKSLENSGIDSLDYKYVIFYNDNLPIGIAYFQLLQIGKIKPDDDSTIAKIGAQIKNTFINALDIRILICGNIFTTGENGFHFDSSISKSQIFENLSNILFQIRVKENNSKTPSVVLLKEFWPDSIDESKDLEIFDFKPFSIDVNMVLAINKEWKSMDDYLASMVTKFRTKAKGCFKKAKEIDTKILDISFVKEHKGRIEELYLNVVEHADFQISKLNRDTFYQFLENLNDDFIITGYFFEDKLVGFKTGFVNGTILEAGYIGLDYEYNYKYAVYQKMLYDYVELAIEMQTSELRLGRTAEEIKSCLGAEPVNMTLYVRHRNSLSNKMVKHVVESISPSEFSVRKPFKHNLI